MNDHSKRRFPKLAVIFLGIAVAAWGLGAVYSVYLNPEVAFFKYGSALKQAYAEKLDREHPNKVVVFGGSSCNTTVEAGHMLEKDGLPTLNMGLGAGFGVPVLSRYALAATRRGDTLIVAMEPPLMTTPFDSPALAVQFCAATGNMGLLRQDPAFSWLSTLLSLRPGGYHALTLLGKIILRQPLYRYQKSEYSPCGWHAVTVQREVVGPPPHGPALSSDACQWLANLQQWGATNGVRVAYTLPWGYVPEDQRAAFEKGNLEFLLQVSRYLPILKDPRIGAYSERQHYADTFWHLIPEAARMHSDELAREIKAWDIWKPGELEQRLAAYSAGK